MHPPGDATASYTSYTIIWCACMWLSICRYEPVAETLLTLAAKRRRRGYYNRLAIQYMVLP